jgi:hypothetical protein
MARCEVMGCSLAVAAGGIGCGELGAVALGTVVTAGSKPCCGFKTGGMGMGAEGGSTGFAETFTGVCGEIVAVVGGVKFAGGRVGVSGEGGGSFAVSTGARACALPGTIAAGMAGARALIMGRAAFGRWSESAATECAGSVGGESAAWDVAGN